MQMKFVGRGTHGPMRAPLGAAGRLAGSSARSRCSPARESVSASNSRTVPERSRTVPSGPSRAGFSAPGAPMRSSFMSFLLKGPAAVDHDGLAGQELALVGAEIDREGGDLLRAAEAAHRLPGDVGRADRLEPAGGRGVLGDALLEARGLHRARADRV